MFAHPFIEHGNMRKLNFGVTLFVRRIEMSTLTIKDLNVSEELSVEAARKVSGGFLMTLATVATGLLLLAADKTGAFESESLPQWMASRM
jgi:hypothetical protein